MKTRILILLAAAFALASCEKQEDLVTNVTGTWHQVINFDSDSSFQYSGNFTIEQSEDGTLTGYFIFEGNVPVYVDLNNSFVDGDNIFMSWNFFGNYPGLRINYLLEFEGTVNGDSMSGIWYFDGEYKGKWEAEKGSSQLKSATNSVTMEDFIERLK